MRGQNDITPGLIRSQQHDSQKWSLRSTPPSAAEARCHLFYPGHHLNTIPQHHSEAQRGPEAGSQLRPEEACPSLLRRGVHGVHGAPAAPLPPQRLLPGPGNLPGPETSSLRTSRVSDTSHASRPHVEHGRHGCEVGEPSGPGFPFNYPRTL